MSSPIASFYVDYLSINHKHIDFIIYIIWRSLALKLKDFNNIQIWTTQIMQIKTRFPGSPKYSCSALPTSASTNHPIKAIWQRNQKKKLIILSILVIVHRSRRVIHCPQR